jgi:hypothetical protein
MGSMNKGKPSGSKADTKRDPGAKSTTHERTGTTGAGPEWSERKQRENREPVHAGGNGGPAQNAGGPDHHGADAHEDKNP